ncbi:MAG: CCA tRNA nucleotidyltransferase [Candidatus Bathyarchaeota archaeon]|nr:MAG: CCA tRNA nucleotidyltransferase [Candidatus Bathyarchaeota archaeon]
MSSTVEKICAEVSKRVTPSNNERRRILELAQNLKKKVTEAAEAEGIKVRVRVEGSVAKDTWLREEPDIDIFIRVPPIVPREEFGETMLRIARKATKGFIQIERFAEHAYLEAIVDKTRVNIVPSYQVEQGEWISAADRTPFHTDYVKARLNEKSCREIRILKKFMKAVDVYGAEIRVGGFSGYLCELLVLNYGSFVRVLETFADWKGRRIIDYEGLYKGKEEDVGRLFEEPLVIIDPVDEGRNVAAAVRVEKLNEFVVAVREFLKNPHLRFFYPSEIATLSNEELARNIEVRGSTLVFVKFRKVETVPDILWGQLYKSQRSIHRALQKHQFNVIRNIVWSDEENLNMFIFEIEERFLSLMKKHLGPPIGKRAECERFLRKHLDAPHTISGPRVEEGRWVVEMKRKHRDVVNLLNDMLRDGGRHVGVADLISQVFSEGFEILVNEEILETCTSNLHFAKFLMEYLKGKPRWLQ